MSGYKKRLKTHQDRITLQGLNQALGGVSLPNPHISREEKSLPDSVGHLSSPGPSLIAFDDRIIFIDRSSLYGEIATPRYSQLIVAVFLFVRDVAGGLLEGSRPVLLFPFFYGDLALKGSVGGNSCCSPTSSSSSSPLFLFLMTSSP
jgi:hypothetical protein